MSPAILHFSRTGSVIKALFFLGVAAIAFAVAALMHSERASPPPIVVGAPDMVLPARPPHRDPLTPFKIPLLVIAGATCLFYAGRHGLRALTRQTAVRIEGGRLYFHPSYGADPNPLPTADIAEAICDRSDRLPGEMSGAVRFGARARHGLYLRYRSDGANRELRVIDNDIDGGTEQLRRFAAQVDAWRRSAAAKAER
ncbi:hypothetical protein [Sphingopyxis sp. DBS4]|uniref:hypothetical protein n=1 Tax=Sphingopyxis sp. DBS4 TaxID=2968500 RepID=UPI00214C6345|nr:hypothetical protein [Sphingopyxis sp. DBS4]